MRTLPGGRSSRISRRSSSSAPSSLRVARWSTSSACSAQSVDAEEGAKCARARVRNVTDLPTYSGWPDALRKM